jgi:hypothetical protein
MKESAMRDSPPIAPQKQAATVAVTPVIKSWLTDRGCRPFIARAASWAPQTGTGGPSVGQIVKESAMSDSPRVAL